MNENPLKKIDLIVICPACNSEVDIDEIAERGGLIGCIYCMNTSHGSRSRFNSNFV